MSEKRYVSSEKGLRIFVESQLLEIDCDDHCLCHGTVIAKEFQNCGSCDPGDLFG
jgi:hypothetical protein